MNRQDIRGEYSPIGSALVLNFHGGSAHEDGKILFAKGWMLDIFCDRGKSKPNTDARANEEPNWDIFSQGGFQLGV